VIINLQHDYEHEHEKATSESGVERWTLSVCPTFELLLTASGISAGIAA
jgi:hypothetical protein